MHDAIFCPNCQRFVGLNGKCQHCNWTRPSQPSPVGQTVWETRLSAEDPIPGMPLFTARITSSNNTVFVPTESGDIFALDTSSGQARWQRTLRADRKLRTLEVAVWGDTILIGAEHLADLPTRDRKLLAWQAATGQDAWAWPTTADSLSIPLVHEGVACFASSEPRLYALDLNTRQLRWSAPSLTWSPDPPAASGEVVVVPSRGPVAVAYSLKTGIRLWTFEADDKESEWLHQRPVVTSDAAYLAGWDRRVYAVDLTTGKLRWRFQAERGVTCPLALADDKLLVAIKDFREGNEDRKAGYGVYALDAATGQVIWKFRTEKHIHISPAVCGDVILLGGDDKRLRALDARDGRELWQIALADKLRAGPHIVGNHVIVGQRNGWVTNIQWRLEPAAHPDPNGLIAQGKLLEAAAELALQGQYEPAARLYAEHDELEHAAALYLEADLPDKAATFFGQLNQFDKALALHQQTGNKFGEAGVLALQNKHDEAAPLYEAMGQLDLAVREYVAADRAGYAAQLLRKAGRRQQAVQLYESVNQADQAAETLVEDGKYAEAAEMFRQMGKPEVAVSVLAQGGLLTEAAALNELLGRTAQAADLYAQAGQTAQAIALYEQLQDWKRVAELAQAINDLPRLALAQAQLGQTSLAAETCERAGDLNRALELYATLDQWDKIESLARQLGRWEQQARALENMGRIGEAGEAYERAAETLEARAPQPTQEIVRLYESAARCYADDENWARQQQCWDKVCQYRQWPNLRGRFELTGPFYQGEFNQVGLVIRNVGYNLARHIMIAEISSKFKMDTSESETSTARLTALSPNQERMMRFSLQPRHDVLGRVMLRVTVIYQDKTGQEHKEEFSQNIEVYGRDEKIAALGRATPPPITPAQVINVQQGNVVVSGTLVEGDQLGPGAQKTTGEMLAVRRREESLARPTEPVAIERILLQDRVRLRNGITRHFSDNELQSLCFDLGIEYDNLPGDDRESKVRELIGYCERRGMLSKLIETCYQLRSNVEW